MKKYCEIPSCTSKPRTKIRIGLAFFEVCTQHIDLGKIEEATLGVQND